MTPDEVDLLRRRVCGEKMSFVPYKAALKAAQLNIEFADGRVKWQPYECPFAREHRSPSVSHHVGRRPSAETQALLDTYRRLVRL